MITLSANLKRIIESNEYQPVLILEIEGLPTTASAHVNKVLRFDDIDFNFDELASFDSPIDDKHILKLIDLKNSSDSITQNLPIDTGGDSSAQTFNVALVDKQGIVTEWITPGLIIDDILGKKAKIYFNVVGGIHSEDSVLIMSGLIDGYVSSAGSVSASVTSAEQYKRSDLFPKTSTKIKSYPVFSTTLASSVASGFGAFVLTDASGFPDPANDSTISRSKKRYLIRINGTDVLSYSAVNYTTKTLTYRLTGEIVLTHDAYTAGMTVELYQMEAGYFIELDDYSTLLRPSIDDTLETYVKIEDEIIRYTGIGYGGITGLTRGCFGTTQAEHPFGSSVDSIYRLQGTMSDLALKIMLSGGDSASAYNVLPKYAGLEMSDDQVDIAEHELMQATYAGQLLDFDFKLTDSIKGSELINRQIYFSNGAFSITRKGKASLGITAPPLAINNPQTLDASNIIKASQIRISRSLNKYFYNAVTYQYEKSISDNAYSQNNLYLSASSTARINVPTKALKITGDGVRFSSTSDYLIDTISKKILDRYQFGAESFQVQVKYSLGMQIENGDSVIFDGAGLNLSDTAKRNGTRNFKPRIMSVVNKQIKPWNNQVTLTLVDTSFTVNGRYGTLSPSSNIYTGSTTTKLFLDSGEEKKWTKYIGEYVLVKNDDWTHAEEKILDRLDDGVAFLRSALSFTPVTGYVLDTASYPNNSIPTDHKYIKSQHVFLDPSVKVVSSTADDRFTVASGDISKFLVDAYVSVHDDSYTNISDDLSIIQIVGNTVILSGSMGFTPTSSYIVDLIGFKDGGLPYRWI